MTSEEAAIENARDPIYARINHAHKELALDAVRRREPGERPAMSRETYIRRLAEKLMVGDSTETYPAEEIAEAREHLRKHGITPPEESAQNG